MIHNVLLPTVSTEHDEGNDGFRWCSGPDNAAMLDLHCPAALEGCLILVRAQAKRVPEAHGILHAELLGRVEASAASGVAAEEVARNLGLPCPQRRGSVQAPVAPGRAGQTILEEHPDDRLK